MNTQEILNILGVTKEGLRSIIKRKQLKSRLLDKGYELVGIEKEGRSNIYIVREVVIVPKETWEELAAKEFPNIRKVKELGIHAKERLIKGTETLQEIVCAAGVTRQTADRWDGLLVEKGYMSDGGYTYCEIRNGILKEITPKEYSEHWSNRNKIRAMVRRLPQVESENKSNDAMMESMVTALQGSYCIRIKNYLVNEFTEQYQRLVIALEK